MPDDAVRDALIRGLADNLGAIDYDSVTLQADGGVGEATEKALEAASPYFYALVQDASWANDPTAVDAVMGAVEAFAQVDIAAYGIASGYTPGIVSAILLDAPFGSKLDAEMAKKIPALLNGMSADDRQLFLSDVISLGVSRNADGSLTAAALRAATRPPGPKSGNGPRIAP